MKILKACNSRSRRTRRHPRLFEWLEPRTLLTANGQNPLNPLDVNVDGNVSPVDAILVINELNRLNAGHDNVKESTGTLSYPLLDVSGDDSISPLDALHVIHSLNLAAEGVVGAASTATATQLGPCSQKIDFSGTGDDWVFAQYGGTTENQGRMFVQERSALLVEGDSFEVTLTRSFVVPQNPAKLEVLYSDLTFDTSSTGRIKDAFELALLDGNGLPLIYSYLGQRDAFFNTTESVGTVVGSGVSASDDKISINLNGIAAGTQANLVLRLINNDGDRASSVRINSVLVPAECGSATVVAAKDDGEWTYREREVWQTDSSRGWKGDVRYADSADPGASAAWTLRLASGNYEVYATWPSSDLNTMNARYEVYDGSQLLSTVESNQKQSPKSLDYDGRSWQSLGDFQFKTGTPTVRLVGQSPGRLVADAVLLAVQRADVQVQAMTVNAVQKQLHRAQDRPVEHGALTDAGLMARPFSMIASASGRDINEAISPAPGEVAIQIESPASGKRFVSGSRVLVTGRALVDSTSATITTVTANGKPVDAIDAAGRFFMQYVVPPGQTDIEFVAVDTTGAAARTYLSIQGVSSLSDIELSTFADVTTSVAGSYGRTSFNDASETLYADLSLLNVGTFAMDSPLLVGTKNISDPSVTVLRASGRTPEGDLYYDFSGVVNGETFNPGETTLPYTLAFSNPKRIPFQYELVFLSNLNTFPDITSVPTLQAVSGTPYVYDLDATDKDDDTLLYELIESPSEMSIVGDTGRISWLPSSSTFGTESIAVRVSDGRGGMAEQRYLINVVAELPNRPPVIVSTPVVAAEVGSQYQYNVVAHDADADRLTFSIVFNPQRMTIDSATGNIYWKPTDDDLGEQHVTVKVVDGRGGETTQAFVVSVRPDDDNRPPRIITDAIEIAIPGQTYRYDVDAIDPDDDRLSYSLIDYPSTMTIDETSGQIAWNSPQHRVPTTISDVNFDDSHWTSMPVPSVGSSRLTAIHSDTGGNPEAYRSFEFANPGTETAFLANIFANRKYEPQVSGAIVSARVELDTFVKPHFLDTQRAPVRAVTGDLNSDGMNDLAVANHLSHTLSVYFGEGAGDFSAPVHINTIVLPGALLIGDVNQDGKLDLIAANASVESQGNDHIAIHFGRGNGTFEDFFTLQSGRDVQGLALGDLNGDTRLDIVTANADAASVSVFLQQLDGTFSARRDYSTGQGTVPRTLILADMNDDRSLDIVVANNNGSGRPDGAILVLMGQGDGAFPSVLKVQLEEPDVGGLSVGDVNRDGHLDIVANHWGPNASDIVSLVFGAGDGTFHGQTKLVVEQSPLWSFVQDLNSDGVLDIVVSYFQGPHAVSVLMGRADGTFAERVTYSTDVAVFSVSIDDVNGDGIADIVGASLAAERVLFLYGRGDGTFAESKSAMEVAPLVVQGDGVYLGKSRQASSQWARLDFGPLGFQDFLLAGGSGPSHPDFSASALPLQFGFATGITGPGALVRAGVDNWSVAITPSNQHRVTVQAADGRGGFDRQSFPIDVAPNRAPEIASIYDKTVRAGEELSFYIGNPGLRAGELMVGNLTSPRSHIVRVTPSSGEQTIIFSRETRGHGIPQEYEKPNFAPGSLLIDNEGQIITNSPFSGLDPQVHTGVRFNPADGQFTEPDLHRVLAHLPNGNYLVEEVGGTGLSEYNLVTGRVRFITSAPIAAPDQVGVYLAHLPNGEVLIDSQNNVFFLYGDRPRRLNLTSGQVSDVGSLRLNDVVPGLVALDSKHIAFVASDYRMRVVDVETGIDELYSEVVIDRGREPWGLTIGEDGVVYGAVDRGRNSGVGRIVAIDRTGSEMRGVVEGLPGSSYRALFAVSRFAANGAIDPDDDALTFGMTGLPAGAKFDATTRRFTWTPTLQQGGHFKVTARVDDDRGGFDTDEFTIHVVGGTDANSNPTISSRPTLLAHAGEPYQYDVVASDPDGESLNFEVVVKPSGMTIHHSLGRLAWDPTPTQIGSHDVVVRVRDPRGGVALQSFQVKVAGSNSVPVITSRPTGPAVVAQPWQYQVVAQDADGEALNFRLDSAPTGMAIGNQTGVIDWTPTPSQVGQSHVTIAVFDSRGGETTQQFELPTVASAVNLTPAITSLPRTTIRLGDTYLYQIVATDPNSDPLTYTLVTKPDAMTVNSSGLVSWRPNSSQLGPQDVAVQVGDSGGLGVVQTFKINVVTQLSNSPPNITSSPRPTAIVGSQYEYNLVAVDPDNDPLVWTLDAKPDGVSIDPMSGALRWIPNADQLGSQQVIVRATDPSGSWATQTIRIDVRGANVPPQIQSIPPTTAFVGESYDYFLSVEDLDRDPLTFSLPASPTGMKIGPGGEIRWTPSSNQLGPTQVRVIVNDGHGGTSSQEFTVVVSDAANNGYPAITSQAPRVAIVGQILEYQVNARDPEGQPLAYLRLIGPDDMTIDQTSGLLRWIPGPEDVGEVRVEVGIVDPLGAGGSQSFTLRVVSGNAPPVIVSTPPSTVIAGAAYLYDVRANDPDGGPVTYQLTTSARAMSIDSLGRIVWRPHVADIGTYQAEVIVTDELGSIVRQPFNVTVTADTIPPTVVLRIEPPTVQAGDPVAIAALAGDNIGVVQRSVAINGTPVPLDGAGRVASLDLGPGVYQIVATAHDAAGNLGSSTTETLTVLGPSGEPVIGVQDGPQVSIAMPLENAVITGLTDVIGTISDTDLASYTISVVSIEDNIEWVIASGTQPAVNGILGQFDPSLLNNGAYYLVVKAKDALNNTTEVRRPIEVSGDLKIGNFTLSFTDLTLPVSGIPITVTRTYDSMVSHQQDSFGYGWRLEFRDMNLRTSVPSLGADSEELGFYQGFQQGDRVYVTRPGGRREGFTFQPRPRSGFAGFLLSEPSFVADPGVTSHLTGPEAVLVVDPQTGRYYSANGLPYNPANELNFPGGYTLTTVEGLAYQIDPITGDLDTLTDANNNALTFTDSAIESNRSGRVTFERDPRGRIIAVVDPAGKKVLYQYDARGDLASVTDREGNETKFIYNEPRRPHFLTEIIDPLGRTGVRSEYDEKGRLKTLRDAAGNSVQLLHDPSNSIEVVVDSRGARTTFEYDDRGNVVRETDALGSVTVRTYDSRNNTLTETDALGNTTRFSYDSLDNVVSEEDALGNITRYTYVQVRPGFLDRVRGARPISLLATTTDPYGNTITSTYSGTNLVSTVDAAGNVTSFTYDAAGNQTSITDAAGNATKFEYDPAGNLTKQIDALGNVTTFTYDVNGNQLTQTTIVTGPNGPRTVTTTSNYGANGSPILTIDAEGNSTRTEYDANGKQIATIDALGRRTSFDYNERGELVKTRFADGTFTVISYDSVGRRESTTDRAGRTTNYRYDEVGRPTATIFPDDTPATLDDNPRTKTEYDAAGRVKAQIDELGNRTEFEYDKAGRQTVVRNALGQMTTTRYDQAGRAIAVTDALGRITRFEYDELGRQVATKFADGTLRKSTFDSLGRAIAETDQAGRTTFYEYDRVGRLTAVVQSVTNRTIRTEYEYDEAGNLVVQRDALGRATRYEYDRLGRRTATQLPLGQRSSTTFDAVGNISSSIDFNGDRTVFSYDVNNRVTKKTFADNTFVSYGYTASGQRASYTDARGTTTWGYDARGRLAAVQQPDQRSLLFNYDAAGNRTATIAPSGTITYTYDELNRLASVIDPDLAKTIYKYDVVSNLVQTQFGNGTTESREYDLLGRLKLLRNLDPNGVTISSYSYTLSPTGRRDAVVEHEGRRVEYGYDELDRLTRELIADATLGNRTISYRYDDVGNRLERDDSVEGRTIYAYDLNDRLLTETLANDVTRYTYDNNGNTLSREHTATDRAFYEWDFENRMIGADVTDAVGTKHIEYLYDADGIRVSSSVAGDETRYLVDPTHRFQQVVEEYTPGGVIKVSYVHGLDLISQNRLADTGKSFYHVDGLGSTRALTNASGLVTDRYLFDAFGRTIGQVGNTGNVYLFAGEQRDLVTGLDYLRSRYLELRTGRLFGRDPHFGLMRLSQTKHPYMYALNSPMTFVDPGGRFSLSEVSITSAVAVILGQISRLTAKIPFAAKAVDAVDKIETANFWFAVAMWSSISESLAPGVPYTVRTQNGSKEFIISNVSTSQEKRVDIFLKYGDQKIAGIINFTHPNQSSPLVFSATGEAIVGKLKIKYAGFGLAEVKLFFDTIAAGIYTTGAGFEPTAAFEAINLEVTLLLPTPRRLWTIKIDAPKPAVGYLFDNL